MLVHVSQEEAHNIWSSGNGCGSRPELQELPVLVLQVLVVLGLLSAWQVPGPAHAV